MGSRTSQLRNRQQIQDSSASATVVVSDDLTHNNNNNNGNGNGPNIKGLKYEQNGSHAEIFSNNNNDQNDNNYNDHGYGDNAANLKQLEDVSKLKETLRAVDALETLNGEQSAEGQHSNGDDKQNSSRQSSISSHLQSLAQRVRRSSSVRRMVPSFVLRKRKVSVSLIVMISEQNDVTRGMMKICLFVLLSSLPLPLKIV